MVQGGYHGPFGISINGRTGYGGSGSGRAYPKHWPSPR